MQLLLLRSKQLPGRRINRAISAKKMLEPDFRHQPERPRQPRPDAGDGGDVSDGRVEETLVERQYDEELLDVHLDDGLADERRAEEGPEGDEEVTARDSSQVEQRVRNRSACLFCGITGLVYHFYQFRT